MTALEMHIEIDLGVQKLNSSVYRNIGPEEKDRILNKMQQYFVDGIIDPSADLKRLGFEANSRRLVDIKNLIVRNKLVPLYIEGNEPNCSFGYIPADFLYPIKGGDRSFTKLSCKTESKPVASRIGLTLFQVDIPTDAVTPFYKDLKLTYVKSDTTEEILFAVNDYYPNGFTDPDEKFMLIDLMLDSINKGGKFKAYWERFEENHKPNRIFIISGEQLNAADRIKVDLDTPILFAGTNIPVDKYSFPGTDYTEGYYKNRLVPQDDLYDIIQNSLAKPKHYSPVSVLADEKLYVYDDGNFRPEKLLLDYVRKPRNINVTLGHDCELSSKSAHNRIVDMAIKHIIREIESGAYQPVTIENQLPQ